MQVYINKIFGASFLNIKNWKQKGFTTIFFLSLDGKAQKGCCYYQRLFLVSQSVSEPILCLAPLNIITLFIIHISAAEPKLKPQGRKPFALAKQSHPGFGLDREEHLEGRIPIHLQ